MPIKFELPVVKANQSIDSGLRRLRSDKVSALVVSGGRQGQRLVTSHDLLQAKLRGSRSLQGVQHGYAVAKPAMSSRAKQRIVDDYDQWPRLFGHSRARYVEVGRKGGRATLISRREEYAGVVSGGSACLCSNPKCPDPTGASNASSGQTCPVCLQGTLACY